MPNEPSNHKKPHLSSSSSKLDGGSDNISLGLKPLLPRLLVKRKPHLSLGLNPLLPRLLVQRKPPLGDCIEFSHGELGTNSSSIPDKPKSLGRR